MGFHTLGSSFFRSGTGSITGKFFFVLVRRIELVHGRRLIDVREVLTVIIVNIQHLI